MDESDKQFYYREDIANQLTAVQAALHMIIVTSNNDPYQLADLEGFEAALQCVAKGFDFYLTLPPRAKQLN